MLMSFVAEGGHTTLRTVGGRMTTGPVRGVTPTTMVRQEGDIGRFESLLRWHEVHRTAQCPLHMKAGLPLEGTEGMMQVMFHRGTR